MFYYTSFHVKLGTWSQDGTLLASSYSILTLYSETDWLDLTLQSDGKSRGRDVGLLATAANGSFFSKVSAPMLFEKPSLGGDTSEFGAPGSSPIEIVGPVFMAAIISTSGDADEWHTLGLEFEYEPLDPDGNRHTAFVYLEGLEVFDEPGFEVLQVTTVDLGTSGISYPAWTLPSYYESGSIEEPEAPGIKLRGTDGMDFLSGMGESDTLKGVGGTDWLDGGGGNDLLIGGAGNDTLQGTAGLNTLRGGTGDDWILGGSDADTIDGGAGSDIVSASGGNDVIRSGGGADEIDAGLGNDRVWGDRGTDMIYLGTGRDKAFGGSGDDTIGGAEGNDRIKGGGGNDVLMGGAGDDNLYGGKGADVFIYESGHDVIHDRDVFDHLSFQVDGLAHATIRADLSSYATEQGDDVWFDFGEGNVLELRNTSFNNLALLLADF